MYSHRYFSTSYFNPGWFPPEESDGEPPVAVTGAGGNSAGVVSAASGVVAIVGAGAHEIATGSIGAATVFVTGEGVGTAEAFSSGVGNAAFLAVGANAVSIAGEALGTVITPRATPQQVRAGVPVIPGTADLTATRGDTVCFARVAAVEAFAFVSGASVTSTRREPAAVDAPAGIPAVVTTTADDATVTTTAADVPAQRRTSTCFATRWPVDVFAPRPAVEITILTRRNQ